MPFMLSVVILDVVMLSFIILSVVAPEKHLIAQIRTRKEKSH
jgi:hypothetical protein